MRVTYCPSSDAAYVYLKDSVAEGEAAATFECAGEAKVRKSQDRVRVGGVMLDFSRDGRLIGVEVLGAWDRLPAEALAQAEVLESDGEPGCRHQWRESNKVLSSLPPQKVRMCTSCGRTEHRPVSEAWE